MSACVGIKVKQNSGIERNDMGDLFITRAFENYEYVALFVGVLALLFWLSLGKNPNPNVRKVIKAVFQNANHGVGNTAFVAKDGLLSEAEKNFLGPLSAVSQRLNLDLVIKVRVADLIEPTSSVDKKTWWKRFRFIAQKHVDYVFLDSDSRPVIAIELNDNSHEEDHRMERDDSLLAAFSDAKIPLLFVPAAHEYATGKLEKKVLDELKRFGIV